METFVKLLLEISNNIYIISLTIPKYISIPTYMYNVTINSLEKDISDILYVTLFS